MKAIIAGVQGSHLSIALKMNRPASKEAKALVSPGLSWCLSQLCLVELVAPIGLLDWPRRVIAYGRPQAARFARRHFLGGCSQGDRDGKVTSMEGGYCGLDLLDRRFVLCDGEDPIERSRLSHKFLAGSCRTHVARIERERLKNLGNAREAFAT
ncbi:MAG: hypothetical protein EOS61_04280 [Mesorhizobium sp.]|nr:MAG: hypothetical protein EOS61_04280 [Mesorhizobium sp.]